MLKIGNPWQAVDQKIRMDDDDPKSSIGIQKLETYPNETAIADDKLVKRPTAGDLQNALQGLKKPGLKTEKATKETTETTTNPLALAAMEKGKKMDTLDVDKFEQQQKERTEEKLKESKKINENPLFKELKKTRKEQNGGKRKKEINKR